MTSEQLILKELKRIKQDVACIKHHMIDSDALLDAEDVQAIEQAEKEMEEGKTIPLSQLKKEIGL